MVTNHLRGLQTSGVDYGTLRKENMQLRNQVEFLTANRIPRELVDTLARSVNTLERTRCYLGQTPWPEGHRLAWIWSIVHLPGWRVS